jgi:hypothetical protein
MHLSTNCLSRDLNLPNWQWLKSSFSFSSSIEQDSDDSFGPIGLVSALQKHSVLRTSSSDRILNIAPIGDSDTHSLTGGRFVINVVFNHEDLFKHFSHAFEQT